MTPHSEEPPVTDSPTIHLWRHIAGAGKITKLVGGDVQVHLPASLAAGVAATCGVGTASAFLNLLTHAALRTLGIEGEPDVADRLEAALRNDGWVDSGSVEALMIAKCEVGESTISVETHEPLEVPKSVDFAGFTPIPNWQGKSLGLREPRRSADGLPAIILGRIGGRPGWSVSEGRTIAGERCTESSLTPPSPYPFDGWPLIVVASEGKVELVEVEWGLESAAEGEVAVLQLTPFAVPSSNHRAKEPEIALAIRLAAGEISPSTRNEAPVVKHLASFGQRGCYTHISERDGEIFFSWSKHLSLRRRVRRWLGRGLHGTIPGVTKAGK